MNKLTWLNLLAAVALASGCTTQLSTEPPSSSKSNSISVAAESTGALAEARSFVSPAINAKTNYHIYLPASYRSQPEKRYPVVYWLHGSGGFPPGVLNMLAKRFHQAISSGKVPAMIVVFPDGLGQSMWLNSKDGNVPMEHVVVNELVPHIDAEFRTVPSPNGRLIEGGSMGGYGAARFGFLYPQVFGAISMLNPGPLQETLEVDNAPIVGRAGAQDVLDRVYGGDIEYFRNQSPWRLAERNTARIQGKLQIRMIVGELDAITQNNRHFSEHLNALEIPHSFKVLAGVDHSPRSMFAALGDDYWEFFVTAFQNTSD